MPLCRPAAHGWPGGCSRFRDGGHAVDATNIKNNGVATIEALRGVAQKADVTLFV
jgi:hypothetical protein